MKIVGEIFVRRKIGRNTNEKIYINDIKILFIIFLLNFNNITF